MFNRDDNLTIVVDNFYSAATGGQDLLSSKAENRNRSTKHKIETAVRGIGVNWVRAVDDTYDLTRMRDAIKDALTTKEKGPKVVIAQSECMLNKQRRTRPAVRQGGEGGQARRARALRASMRRPAPATMPASGFRAVRR